MSQITTKWISDQAITPVKLDSSGTFTMAGLYVTGDATIGNDLTIVGDIVGDVSFAGDATIANNLYVTNRVEIGPSAIYNAQDDLHITGANPAGLGIKMTNAAGTSEFTINAGGSAGGGTNGLIIRDEYSSINAIKIKNGLVEVGQFKAADGTFSNSINVGGTDGTSVTAVATTGTALKGQADPTGLGLDIDGTSYFRGGIGVGEIPSFALVHINDNGNAIQALELISVAPLGVRIQDNAAAATAFRSETVDGTSIYGYTTSGTALKGYAVSGGLGLDIIGNSKLDGTCEFSNCAVGMAVLPQDGITLKVRGTGKALDVQSSGNTVALIVANAGRTALEVNSSTDGTGIYANTQSGVALRGYASSGGYGLVSDGLTLLDGTTVINDDLGIGTTPSGGTARVEIVENDREALDINCGGATALKIIDNAVAATALRSDTVDGTSVYGYSYSGVALRGETALGLGLGLDILGNSKLDGTCEFSNCAVGIRTVPADGIALKIRDAGNIQALSVYSGGNVAVIEAPTAGKIALEVLSYVDGTGVKASTQSGVALRGTAQASGYNLYTSGGKATINSDSSIVLSAAESISSSCSGEITVSCAQRLYLNGGLDATLSGGSGGVDIGCANNININCGGNIILSSGTQTQVDGSCEFTDCAVGMAVAPQDGITLKVRGTGKALDVYSTAASLVSLFDSANNATTLEVDSHGASGVGLYARSFSGSLAIRSDGSAVFENDVTIKGNVNNNLTITANPGAHALKLAASGSGDLNIGFSSGSDAYLIESTNHPLQIKTLASQDMTALSQGHLRLGAPAGNLRLDALSTMVDGTCEFSNCAVGMASAPQDGITLKVRGTGKALDVNSTSATLTSLFDSASNATTLEVDSHGAAGIGLYARSFSGSLAAKADGSCQINGQVTLTTGGTGLLISATGSDQLQLQNSFTPSDTSDANGSTGSIAWDDGYLYVKTSVGWKRATLNTF